MSRTIFTAAFLFIALRALLAQEEPNENEDTSAGLPKEYADYLIASSTLSPDKKFAVIYPKMEVCTEEQKKGLRESLQRLSGRSGALRDSHHPRDQIS